jgi:hypothetical protein
VTEIPGIATADYVIRPRNTQSATARYVILLMPESAAGPHHSRNVGAFAFAQVDHHYAPVVEPVHVPNGDADDAGRYAISAMVRGVCWPLLFAQRLVPLAVRGRSEQESSDEFGGCGL